MKNKKNIIKGWLISLLVLLVLFNNISAVKAIDSSIIEETNLTEIDEAITNEDITQEFLRTYVNSRYYNINEDSSRPFYLKITDALAKKQEISLLSDKDIALAKKCAKIICTYLVEKYAPLMNVYPKNIKITSAKKSFGSCSGKNNICFSYYLMLYSMEAITYVVVHELAHIKHHNHSSNFHNYVKKYLPEAKNYEKLLEPSFAKYDNFIKNVEYSKNIYLNHIQ